MAYRLSQLAELDLEDIGIYTVDHWGFDQWVAYLSDLTDAFEMLERFPNLGKVLPQTQAHVRSYTANKHMIRYTIEPDDSITIVHDRPCLARSAPDFLTNLISPSDRLCRNTQSR